MSMNIRKMEKTRYRFLCVAMTFFTMFMTSIAINVHATKNSGDSEPSKVIVSLGDSYSSGEGIEPFYDQGASNEQKIANQDWLAHRSQNSWPGMLTLPAVDGSMAKHRGENWFFVAASGAETRHMLNGQNKKYDFWNDLSFAKSVDLHGQLEVFKSMGNKKADYVTLTLGGNDMGFADIVTSAVTGSTYLNTSGLADKLNNTWEKFYVKDGIRDDLHKAYKDIKNKAKGNPKIIVAGYPKLLDQEGKGALFSLQEATWINGSVRIFNWEIENLINDCKKSGMEIYFAPVEEAFDGHEAYSDDPYINGVILGKQAEDLMFDVASAYSMHPNFKGAKAYAQCVQKKINELEKEQVRDIVLALDVSGSMAGTSMEETKKASTNFINTILKQDAAIGIVTYDDESTILSGFNLNEEYLSEAVYEINSGGGTNIEAGLSEAYDMLKSSSSEKRIIVLMSDGEPNEGKVGDELIAFADQIKSDGVSIYTLGFFETIGNKSSAQALMERIASDGCHYEVANANDLVFFFGDVADQLNGQKYIYVRIACPVDVSVSYHGETLNSSEDNLCTRTDFGTLTFEENEELSDDRIKILRLKDGTDYDVHIEGTGRGAMDYTIGFMDESGQYSDLRKFRIPITKRTAIDTLAKTANTTVLYVDKDGDGKYDMQYRATENGRGKIVDYTYLYYLAGGVTALLLLFVAAMMIKRKLKK